MSPPELGGGKMEQEHEHRAPRVRARPTTTTVWYPLASSNLPPPANMTVVTPGIL